jgi:hypothetical protein
MRGIFQIEGILAVPSDVVRCGNMFSFSHWEIPGCILVLGKRCLCMALLRIFVSFSSLLIDRPASSSSVAFSSIVLVA